ncbi:MAG: hypothetical protein ACJ8D5_03475 [Sphingomicrobium sp.]
MKDDETRAAEEQSEFRPSARRRAIDAYGNVGQRTADSLSQAPLIALAGGLAAGALIAALLPRTESEARLVRPTARRVKDSARAAVKAARDTGTDRLNELGLTRDKGEETIRSLFQGVTDAAKASGQAALDTVRNKG